MQRRRFITAGVETVLAKIVAGFLAVVGAVSAFIAMLSLKRLEQKHHATALLKARQEAEAQNEKRQEKLEEEIAQAVEPLRDLGDSRDDREKLAALLDE